MMEHINIFNYDIKLIAIFVERLRTYIETIKNHLKNPKNIDSLDQFEISEYQNAKTILERNLYAYQEAFDVHTTQYKQISQLYQNYAIYFNQIRTFHLTKFPSLCTLAAISSSIVSQRESKVSIKEFCMLLQNLIKSNNDYLSNKMNFENLDIDAYEMLGDNGVEQESSNKILAKK